MHNILQIPFYSLYNLIKMLPADFQRLIEIFVAVHARFRVVREHIGWPLDVAGVWSGHEAATFAAAFANKTRCPDRRKRTFRRRVDVREHRTRHSPREVLIHLLYILHDRPYLFDIVLWLCFGKKKRSKHSWKDFNAKRSVVLFNTRFSARTRRDPTRCILFERDSGSRKQQKHVND